MSSTVLALGLLAVDRDDLVADGQAGRLGRAAGEDADDQRQAVLGRVDPDADPDVLAGQIVVRASARSSGVRNEVWPVSPTASVMPVDRAVDEGLCR